MLLPRCRACPYPAYCSYYRACPLQKRPERESQLLDRGRSPRGRWGAPKRPCRALSRKQTAAQVQKGKTQRTVGHVTPSEHEPSPWPYIRRPRSFILGLQLSGRGQDNVSRKRERGSDKIRSLEHYCCRSGLVGVGTASKKTHNDRDRASSSRSWALFHHAQDVADPATTVFGSILETDTLETSVTVPRRGLTYHKGRTCGAVSVAGCWLRWAFYIMPRMTPIRQPWCMAISFSLRC